MGSGLIKQAIEKYCGAEVVPEFRFHPSRRFRIDYAIPSHRIAIEIEGGAWIGGRHTRGRGFIGDMEKYNLLTEYGWRLLRYQPGKIDYSQIARVVDSTQKCE